MTVKEWWATLQAREKQMVMSGGGFLALALLYWLIWLPFSDRLTQLKTTIRAQKSLLVWMKNATQELKSLEKTEKKTQSISTDSLLTITEQTLEKKKLRLFVTTIGQTDQNNVSVTFKGVSFDALLTWLTQIFETYQIRANTLSITKSKTLGIVDAKVKIGIRQSKST